MFPRNEAEEEELGLRYPVKEIDGTPERPCKEVSIKTGDPRTERYLLTRTSVGKKQADRDPGE